MSLDLSDTDYVEAIEHYLNGEGADAKRVLEALSVRYPKDHFIPFLLGNTMYSLGRMSEAINYYLHAIELKPDFGHAYYKLGVAYYRCGRLEKGLAAFKRVIELKDQSHAMATYFAGLINHLLGNDEAALEGFTRLRTVSPESLIANFHLAQLRMKQRRYGEALSLLTDLSEVSPNLAEVHYLIGTVQYRMHSNSEAIKSFRRTLELSPHDTRAQSILELLVES